MCIRDRLHLGSSQPRPPDTRQYPPRRLRSTKAWVRPTAGGYAAAPWQRSRPLRPRAAGTRVRCAAQTLLHIFRYRLVAAARMLTVRSSADTRTSTARGRYLGPPRGRSPCRVYRWQKRARKTKRHSVRKNNHQSLHNSIRRPESMPRNGAPECCTQSSIVLNVQPRTQVISPGPVANGLTICRPPAEAPPATPAAAYACHASRSSLQQKHTTAEEAHSGRRLPPVERMCVRARRQGPTTDAATTETSHASRSSSSSSQQAHDLCRSDIEVRHRVQLGSTRSCYVKAC